MFTIRAERIHELDMVKGLVIAPVVLRHLCELTGANVYYPNLFRIFCNTCGESHMIVFVLLSGYVYHSKGSLGEELRSKVRRLLVPFFGFTAFFSFTYFIRYVLLGDMNLKQFAVNTLGNFAAAPGLGPLLFPDCSSNSMVYAFVPYWYVAQIFNALLLFLLINRLLEKKKLITRAVTTGALLILTAVYSYFDGIYGTSGKFAAGYSYFFIVTNVLGFTAVLLLGSLLRQIELFNLKAHSTKWNAALFTVCLANNAVQAALYGNPQYCFQFGDWGRYGCWSVFLTTVTGFTLAYCMVAVCYYLKELRPVRAILTALGRYSLDILLIHFGTAEIWCAILGFWYPVYTVAYPQEAFAWWHLPLVLALTAGCIAAFEYGKCKIHKLNYIMLIIFS